MSRLGFKQQTIVHVKALEKRVHDLEVALRVLLDDSQHKVHASCATGPCPVREAREVLAAGNFAPPVDPREEEE